MEVTYTTTLEDYVTYSMHTLKRSRSMKLWFGLTWALVPMACWIWAVLLVTTIPTIAAVLAVGGVACAVIYPPIYRACNKWAIRTYAKDLGAQGMIGRITLVLTDDTLTERTESVQSVARWQDMKGMEVVGECTYIYVAGLLTAIIPRHGFERTEDYEAVRDFALAKFTRQAKAGGGSWTF